MFRPPTLKLVLKYCFFFTQDITSFDFHESLATLSNSQSNDSAENGEANSSLQNVTGVTANEVVIEVDPLNDHECMAHLVIYFLFFMNLKHGYLDCSATTAG